MKTQTGKIKDISHEPAMKKLKKVYQEMSLEGQQRTLGYLREKVRKEKSDNF